MQNCILINTHIGIQEYEKCSLLYPLVKILEFTKHVFALFHANIQDLILNKKKLICKRILKLIISHVSKRRYTYSLSICKDCNTQYF